MIKLLATLEKKTAFDNIIIIYVYIAPFKGLKGCSTSAGTLKVISSKLQLNLSLNEGSRTDIEVGSGLDFRSFLLKTTQECVFTVGSQNNRPFSCCHESLDG